MPRVMFCLRMSPDLLERLRAYAALEHRTVTNAAEFLIGRGFEVEGLGGFDHAVGDPGGGGAAGRVRRRNDDDARPAGNAGGRGRSRRR